MQMQNKTTVVARHVSKTYPLTSRGSQHLLFKKKSDRGVEALKDVSFVSEAGESIGVVGRNGAGKSTLFKLISGAESPSQGEIFVSSTPTLLGVSSALQGKLTGRDNIRLGLFAMGLSPGEAEQIEGEVAEFAEITDAVDRPLKTYSSGMRARLVFAVSTAVRREILLVDEALSTGDSAFADRAQERMNSFLDEAGTVFIVSHGAGTIKKYCTRALWIHEGQVIMDSSAQETSDLYVKWSKMRSRGENERAEELMARCRRDYKPPKILFDDEVASFLDASPSSSRKRRHLRRNNRRSREDS